jgi:hypothetical protein
MKKILFTLIASALLFSCHSTKECLTSEKTCCKEKTEKSCCKNKTEKTCHTTEKKTEKSCCTKK